MLTAGEVGLQAVVEDTGHNVTANDEEDVDAIGSEAAQMWKNEAGVGDYHGESGECSQNLNIVELDVSIQG